MPLAFITGVTGQDGTYLARRLLAEGLKVHGLVRPGSISPVEAGVVVHEVDVREGAALSGLVADLQPDELYHLAGQSSVGASWTDPAGTVEQTGTPVATLLLAVAETSPHTRLVVASSSEIFGTAPAPQDEETPISPVSPYGAAKALAHFLVSAFRARGLHASSGILYNHESPLRDERFVTGKIAASVARIARGRQERLALGSLDVERDWGWAPDYVDALIRAVRHPTPGDYVVGTGTTHTVREFATTAFSVAGLGDAERYLDIDPAFVRPADPATQRANSARARAVLGWQPTVAFPEIVERMVLARLAELDADGPVRAT
jgi:GDPmannose 4,6-dehydratase